jgi:histidine decarboxylase
MADIEPMPFHIFTIPFIFYFPYPTAMPKNVAALLEKVLSPLDHYCSSSGMSPANPYITTPLISTGVTVMDCSHSGSQLLDNIVAFDRAEASYANITQTNMVTVSSFNGPNGLIWGYDLLPQELRLHPLANLPAEHPLHERVYDAEPLFRATQALYGTVEEKRFPILPGEHLLCAYKTMHQQGPCLIYGALAIAVPEDRTCNADLYMEDHGTLLASHDKGANLDQQTTVIENMLRSIEKISQNLGVRYEKVFIGLKCKNVQPGEVGCVITAAPYIHLARKAVPHENPATLMNISLSEWESLVQPQFLNTSHTRDTSDVSLGQFRADPLDSAHSETHSLMT